MSEATEIRVGQKWQRKRDGADFTVISVHEKFVVIRRRGWDVVPWTKSFLKAYELVQDAP